MITLSRLARTKQLFVTNQRHEHLTLIKRKTHYALGNERPKDAITSAIQMVADLETPTRQWTKVAVLSTFPFPMQQNFTISIYSRTILGGELTNKFQTPVEFLSQRIYAIILNLINKHQVLLSPHAQFRVGPADRFTNA